MKPYYPAFLDLDGQACLVVGGGAVAEQKVRPLLDCGGVVTVISPEVTPGLAAMADSSAIRWIERRYESGDLEGCVLVICATNVPEVNEQVAGEAEARRVLVNVVDVPHLCGFIVPSILRRGDLCIAVSTGGASPTMAKRIRQQLESQYGPEYGVLLDVLGGYRARMKTQHPDDPAERQTRWERLSETTLLELIRDGRMDEVREQVEACISRS